MSQNERSKANSMSWITKQKTGRFRGLTQRAMGWVSKQMSCYGPVPEAEAAFWMFSGT